MLAVVDVDAVVHYTAQAPSRLQQLEDELKRAQEATGEWIDADLMKGFVQRERRLEVYTLCYAYTVLTIQYVLQ
jgi:hypothetical protein